jgi:hypothetical protein
MEELARFYLNYTIGPCSSCARWYFILVPAELSEFKRQRIPTYREM